MLTDVKSLFAFPSRAKIRNEIDFDGVEKQECTKVYMKGKSSVPAFPEVQCCCAHPKLLSVVLVRECECISTALSCILTHFAVPPRRGLYDNACNMFNSTITRIPWLLRYTMLVVDRFHCNGHNCCKVYNGNVHRFMDGCRSVSTEVINVIIDKGRSHIAYLKSNNVIPFMKVLFSQMNATAKVRDYIVKKDLEDVDVLRRFRDRFTYYCSACTASTTATARQYTDGVSIFRRTNICIPLDTDGNAVTTKGEQLANDIDDAESDADGERTDD